MLIYFSYLQLDDLDSTIWILLYLISSLMILINHKYTIHFCVIIFTISAFIFTQNISIIFNTINPSNETFYEFGGIMIAMSLSYIKIKEII